MMNVFGGSPGLQILERQVEQRILEVFSEIERLGGVLAAQEQRYQRSQIQQAAHAYETQIYSTGQRPIIGLNRYASDEKMADVPNSRTPIAKQRLAVNRLRAFKKKNAKKSAAALQRLENVCNSNGNVFAELLNAVEVCSLGQITECLHGCVGKFRPMV
jgi:methylmalonyl-CoA mutase